jgi:hypothetical protein
MPTILAPLPRKAALEGVSVMLAISRRRHLAAQERQLGRGIYPQADNQIVADIEPSLHRLDPTVVWPAGREGGAVAPIWWGTGPFAYLADENWQSATVMC